jgi:hypothetical protein
MFIVDCVCVSCSVFADQTPLAARVHHVAEQAVMEARHKQSALLHAEHVLRRHNDAIRTAIEEGQSLELAVREFSDRAI